METSNERKINQAIKKVLKLCSVDPKEFAFRLNGSSKIDYLLEAVDMLETYTKKEVLKKGVPTNTRSVLYRQLEKRIETLSEVLQETNKKLAEEKLSNKKTEDYLRRNEEKFRQIIENASDVIYTSSPEGNFTYINDACKKLSGYSKEYFIGKPFTIIVAPEWKQRVAEFYAEQFRKREKKTLFSFPIITKYGRTKWVEQIVLQVMEEGRIVEYQSIVRDITERKAAEDTLSKYAKQIAELNSTLQENISQLEVANQELKAFSYTVSHDLRAPLRAINSYATILMEECDERLSEKEKAMLHTVISNAVKMGQLIDQLLAFSSLGRKEIQRRPVNMRGLCKKVLEELGKMTSLRNVTVRIGQLPTAVCDYELVRQVFINLLSNAIKFSASSKKPVLEIGSMKKDGRIVYYVKDNGVGFDMKFFDKLFGVFQKLHEPQKYEGTGAGLAIVRRIVEKHGGEVWAEGKVNNGATFYFSLSKKKDMKPVKTIKI
jgi:PAS domain S-box-containing protein